MADSIAEPRSRSTSTSVPEPSRISSAICERILRAGIVVRDDDPVGKLLGDPSHLGSFRPIAVAARAEDDGQASLTERARGLEHGREGVGLVRVVHDDGELLTLVDRLEAAGHARHGSHAAGDRVLVDVEEERSRDGPEDVLDVEDPEQPRLEHGSRPR